jgi:hypothetical protein
MRRFLRAMLRPLRPLGRPIVRKLRARVTFWARRATDERFERVESKLAETRADLEGLEHYVPALLNAIAAQNALNRANVRTEAELARLVSSVLEEFQSVRNEIVRAREGGLDPVFEPKVLHPEALAVEALRLNLGSGAAPRSGYVNVDTQPFDGTDVLAHPAGLPFEADSVAEIRAVHLLDHYSLDEGRGTLLPHWVRILRPSGTLTVVVPDGDSLTRAYVAGELSFEELRDATFGQGADDCSVRFTMFSRTSIVDLFAAVGLEEIELRADPRGQSREIEVVGRKPGHAPS